MYIEKRERVSERVARGWKKRDRKREEEEEWIKLKRGRGGGTVEFIKHNIKNRRREGE